MTTEPKMSATGAPRPATNGDPHENQPSWTVQNPWTPVPRVETSFARKVFIAFSLTAAVLIVMVPVVVLFMRYTGGLLRGTEQVFCETQDCANHANLIKAGLDYSVNPCVNFASFVCGKAPREDLYDTLKLSGIITTLKKLGSTDDSKVKSSAITKAKKFFYSCSQRNATAGNDGLDVFKNLTGRLRIPWPDPSPKNTDPLDVLLDLAINWAICIWINVQMYRTVDGTVRVIFTSKCDSLITGQGRPQINSDDEYTAYTNKYCDLLKREESCVKNVQQLREDEEFVWNSLAGNRSAYNPVVFTLEDMNNFTASIPSKVWVDLLNKHFRPSYPFSNYMVLARDGRALKAIGEVVAKLSAERVLAQISWTFVQRYAWIAMPQAAAFLRSDAQTDDRQTSACLTVVENIMGLLLRADFIYSAFPEPEREKINHVFDAIANATQGYVQNAGWLTQDKVIISSVKLASMQTNVWPSSAFFNVTTLGLLYSDFPSMTEDFMTSWVLSRQVLASKITNRNYSNNQLYDKSYDTVYGLFSYLNYVNVMDVSLSAFQGPLYYSNGTAAINYGGLGGRYATEFLKGLYDVYTVSAAMNSDDDALAWLFATNPNTSRRVARNTPTCILQGSKPHPLFPFVPALQVAHKAFKSEQQLHTGDPGSDVRLKALKEYSADKIFFITFCRAMCNVPDACNTAVSNFVPFASTFECPDGAAMNPTEKCPFFQKSLFSDPDYPVRRWSKWSPL